MVRALRQDVKIQELEEFLRNVEKFAVETQRSLQFTFFITGSSIRVFVIGSVLLWYK